MVARRERDTENAIATVIRATVEKTTATVISAAALEKTTVTVIVSVVSMTLADVLTDIISTIGQFVAVFTVVHVSTVARN